MEPFLLRPISTQVFTILVLDFLILKEKMTVLNQFVVHQLAEYSGKSDVQWNRQMVEFFQKYFAKQ